MTHWLSYLLVKSILKYWLNKWLSYMRRFMRSLLVSIYLSLQVMMASVINCYMKLQFLSMNLFVTYSTIQGTSLKCGKLLIKVFEILLFNYIYHFLKVNGLLKINQSGFTPGDNTINQLINICNKIHCQLDNDDEILTVFLDQSKVFDKVWHKDLLCKL